MIVVGIDPGITGAVAVLDHGIFGGVSSIPTIVNGKGRSVVKARVDAASLADLFRLIRGTYSGEPLLAVCERVNAMPGQGSASVFSLGDTSGVIRGVLATLGLRTEWVAPSAWKKAMKLGPDKDAARTYAIERFPLAASHLALKKDHNKAEAILIAAWAHEEFA